MQPASQTLCSHQTFQVTCPHAQKDRTFQHAWQKLGNIIQMQSQFSGIMTMIYRRRDDRALPATKMGRERETHRKIRSVRQMHHEQPLGLFWPRDMGWEIWVQVLLKIWPPEHAYALSNLHNTTDPQACASTSCGVPCRSRVACFPVYRLASKVFAAPKQLMFRVGAASHPDHYANWAKMAAL